MTAVDVDALDKLREAATAGPWAVIDWDNFEGIAIGPPEGCSETPVVAVDVGVVRADDAALIVAAVNALEPLIAEVRRGRALREAVDGLAEELEAWRGNARRYEQHALAEGSQDLANHAHVRALAYERAIDGIRTVVAAVDGGEQS